MTTPEQALRDKRCMDKIVEAMDTLQQVRNDICDDAGMHEQNLQTARDKVLQARLELATGEDLQKVALADFTHATIRVARLMEAGVPIGKDVRHCINLLEHAADKKAA